MSAPEPPTEPTAVEQLADYECPECGPMADLNPTEREAEVVLGGDELGFTRCLNDWCDEELDLTVDAAVSRLAWLAERRPDLAASITEAVTEAVDG